MLWAHYYTMPIPGQLARKAFVVSSWPSTFLFIEGNVPVGPWMLLHRESHSDFEVINLLRSSRGSGFSGGLAGGALATKLVQDFNLGRDGSWLTSVSDEVLTHIFNGRISVYKLPSDAYQDLSRPECIYWATHSFLTNFPVGSVPYIQGHLVCELGAALSPRWITYAASHQAYSSEPWYQQGFILAGAATDGAFDGFIGGITGIWDALSSAAGALRDCGWVTLQTAGQNFVQGSIAVLNFHMQVLEGKFAEIAQIFAKFGVKVWKNAKEMANAVRDGYDLLMGLLQDGGVGKVMAEYLDGMRESIDKVSKARFVGGAAGVIGLEVLLALATAGLGNAAKWTVQTIGSGTRMLGPFSIRAIHIMADLAKTKRSHSVKEVADQEASQAIANKQVSDTPKQIESHRRMASNPNGPKLEGKQSGTVLDQQRNNDASKKASGVTAPIDFDGHITAGEITPKGKVVGGHSIATGKVREIPGSRTATNSSGVYKAKVEIENPNVPGQWVPKNTNNDYSTMFPDSWSADRVKVEVDEAFKNKTVVGNRWSGVTPSGVKVKGYLSPKTTVYPEM